jgi:hypothetical protein
LSILRARQRVGILNYGVWCDQNPLTGVGSRRKDISWVVFFKAVKSTSIARPSACEIIPAEEPMKSNQTLNLTGDEPGFTVDALDPRGLNRVGLRGGMGLRICSFAVEVLQGEEDGPNENSGNKKSVNCARLSLRQYMGIANRETV